MNKTSTLVTAAIAGLMLTGGISAGKKGHGDEGAHKKGKHKNAGMCMGINSCKGKGDCTGETHGCAGQNSCKGKGWKKMSKAECKEADGKFKKMKG